MKRFLKIITFISLIVVICLGVFLSLELSRPVDAVMPMQTRIPDDYIKTPKKLDADKLWSLIQDWRVENGLQPYIKDQRLCVIAEDRVDDGDNYHEGFIKKMESNYYNLPEGVLVSENATGGTSEENMLQRWLNSPTHAETLGKSYNYSCVAVYGTTDPEYYAVQIFSNFKQ